MSRLRTRGAAVLLGALGAGLALLALTATWGAGRTGHQAAPAAFATSLASLAGAGVLLLLGSKGRRVVGLVLVLLGVVTVVAAWRGAGAVSDPVVAWVAVTVVGGLLVVLAGGLAALGGAGWSETAGRYSASGRPADTDLWRALDQGVDPTTDD